MIYQPIVGTLIRTVVKHLQELRAAQVEHELHGGRERGREEVRMSKTCILLLHYLRIE